MFLAIALFFLIVRQFVVFRKLLDTICGGEGGICILICWVFAHYLHPKMKLCMDDRTASWSNVQIPIRLWGLFCWILANVWTKRCPLPSAALRLAGVIVPFHVLNGPFVTVRSNRWQQMPKGRLINGPYKPICRDCAIYFSTTVEVDTTWVDFLLLVIVCVRIMVNHQLEKM